MWALTLWQPWATLIAMGIKLIETRVWRPPARVLHKPMAIHAGMTIADDKTIGGTQVEAKIIELLGVEWRAIIPTGAVVATAVVTNGYKTAGFINNGYVRVLDGKRYAKVKHDPYGDFSDERWLWMLKDIRPMDPPFKVAGRLGLWHLDYHAAQLPMDDPVIGQGALLG